MRELAGSKRRLGFWMRSAPRSRREKHKCKVAPGNIHKHEFCYVYRCCSCVGTYMAISVSISISVSINIYLYPHLYLHLYLHPYLHLYLHLHLYLYLYLCLYNKVYTHAHGTTLV